MKISEAVEILDDLAKGYSDHARNSEYEALEIAIDSICDKTDEVKKVKIKYFDNEIKKLDKIYFGDWIDLRASEDVTLEAGEYGLIPLGVGMILPKGYEAHVVPRSSTFKNFGILQTNHFGVIDNSYCGDDDQWMFPALAVRDTVIHKGDRICQFRIAKNQPILNFEEVEHLNEFSRGGFGSTGIK